MASGSKKLNKNGPDPEMLKHMDLLDSMDLLEDESDWETVEELEEVESYKGNENE